MRARNFIAAAVFAASCLPAAVSAAPPGYDDPLARVEGRLCPGTAGMRTDAAVAIVDRIRADAEQVGVPLADPENCDPNLLIFFVNDTDKTMDSLMAKQPYLFGSLSESERRALKGTSGPVRAWSQIATRSRDGMKINNPDNLVQIPRTSMWGAHSKIYVPVQREILTTVVLFDNREIVGKSVTQLADYAAMRAFANDFSTLPQDRHSILKLFDSGTAPTELTEADMVFLKTLYSGIANVPGRFKKRTLTEALDRQASAQ